MKNAFAEVDTHAVLLMEDKEMKTYRQKILAEKQQHDWEMRLLEKERRISWNSDRVEKNRLLSRLQKINKRILEINKANSGKQKQPATQLQGGCEGIVTSPKKADENEKNAAMAKMPFLSSTWPGGMGYLYQDSRGVAQKQKHQNASPHELPSKNEKKRDHRRPSKTDNNKDKKEPVKPNLARRPSMDPKVLASLLSVDESSVQKQNQVFQRARLNSDAALRANADTQENPEENNKKTSAKTFQRRATVASMHLSSDLLKVGFPDWKAREEMLPMTWSTTKPSPGGFSAFSRGRRSSLPSLSPANHGKFTKPGSTATRRKSIGSTKLKTSSLNKLENVIEESEEHLHHSERDETMRNLIQSVMAIDYRLPLLLRKKEL
ncbi:uncharacterized protein LOC144883665 [Branchiostoma floridae x Branchiostoma japonicum]